MVSQNKDVLAIIEKYGLAIHKLKSTNLAFPRFRQIYKEHIKTFNFDSSKCDIKQIRDITFEQDFILNVRTESESHTNINVSEINGCLFMCLKDYEYYLRGKITMLEDFMKKCEFKEKEQSNESGANESMEVSSETHKQIKKEEQRNLKIGGVANNKRVTFAENIESVHQFRSEETYDNVLNEARVGKPEKIHTLNRTEDDMIDEFHADIQLEDENIVFEDLEISTTSNDDLSINKFNQEEIFKHEYNKNENNSSTDEQSKRCKGDADNLESQVKYFDEHSENIEIESNEIISVESYSEGKHVNSSRIYLSEIYEKLEPEIVDYPETYDN